MSLGTDIIWVFFDGLRESWGVGDSGSCRVLIDYLKRVLVLVYGMGFFSMKGFFPRRVFIFYLVLLRLDLAEGY